MLTNLTDLVNIDYIDLRNLYAGAVESARLRLRNVEIS